MSEDYSQQSNQYQHLNSLVRNSLYNALYRLLNVLFPLVTLSYVSHIFNAEGIGRISSAQNIAQYFILAAALGIPQYGTREIAKSLTNERNITFNELFTINAISTIFFSSAYFVFIVAFPFGDKKLYIIAGISVLLNLFNIDWLYQGLEKYDYIMFRSLLVKGVSLLLVLLCINTETDIYTYMLINASALAGNYLFNILHLRKMGIYVSFSMDATKIIPRLSPILVMFGTTVSIELYTLADTTMLTAFSDASNVGIYAVSMKLVKIIIVLITAISTTLLPRLSCLYSDNRIDDCEYIVSCTLEILVFLFIPCGIGLIILAPDFILALFGESFAEGVITLRIAALLIYTLGFSNLFGTQILITASAERQLLKATIAGAFINILLNSIMIPKWDQNGAAAASVISEGIVTLVTYYFSRRYIRAKVRMDVIIKTVASAILMGGDRLSESNQILTI